MILAKLDYRSIRHTIATNPNKNASICPQKSDNGLAEKQTCDLNEQR